MNAEISETVKAKKLGLGKLIQGSKGNRNS